MHPYPPTRIVVIGLGHEDSGDDGAGPAVSRQLASQPGVRIETCVGAEALARAWEGADSVILIDAFDSGGLPGAVLRLHSPSGEFPARLLEYSRHSGELGEAAKIARRRGRIPRMVVFGIEGVNFASGNFLSEAVAKAAIRLSDRVRREIHQTRTHLRHELSLIKDLLKKVDTVAEEQRPARVVGITVCLGALSDISPAHFREQFTDATRGTHLDGVHLDVERVGDANGPEAEDIMLDTVELEE